MASKEKSRLTKAVSQILKRIRGGSGYAAGGSVSQAELQYFFDQKNAGNSGAPPSPNSTNPATIAERALYDQQVLGISPSSTSTNTAIDPAVAAQTAGTTNLLNASVNDPTSIMKTADVGTMDATAGQLDPTNVLKQGAANVVSTAKATPAAAVKAPNVPNAPQVSTAKASAGVNRITNQTKAAQGAVGDNALVEGATMDPQDLASLGLDAAQIAAPQVVQDVGELTLQPGELIDGSSVDMAAVEKVAKMEAATALPSEKATVAGQLKDLTEGFDTKNPPPWAAASIRAANAEMASRGIGASSMAGQAVLQASLEAALPIAMQDAQTRASFESQNLSNKQQAALFGAEQRAKFLGMKFDQDFQSKVVNAARIGEIATINFTSDQQIALENAKLAQTVDIANLDAKNAKVLADAAAMTQLDLTNLSNIQQAQVQNAKAFLEMDMTNLNNQQQTVMMNSQARVQALLSDTSMANAARQFNASSKQQADQFEASLINQTQQFNTAQTNAIRQFNAGESNALRQFNAQQRNARDQFNAQNSLIVEQANAQWRANVETTQFAAQHEANMQTAKDANGITTAALDNIWQRERDIMSFAFTDGQNAMDRAVNLMLADKDLIAVRDQISGAMAETKASNKYGAYEFAGNAISRLVFGGT